MKRLLIVGLIIIQCSWLIAGGVGTTGANYLKIGLGAKAAAMGENFTAMADDASAPYWNAAGLTSQNKTRLDFMQLNWVAGISAKTFLGVYPLSENDFIGGYAFMLDTPQDKETRYADAPVISYEETGASFKSEASIMNLSYAHKFSEVLSVGLGFKAIQENLAGDSAKGFSMDAGIIYKDALPQTTLGVAVQNLAGVKLRQNEDLPRIISFGALYTTELWKNKLNVVGDIKLPNDNVMTYGVGGEYWLANIIAARVGYSSFSKISLGLGISFKDIFADYAYVPLGDLGVTHRIAVGYAFDIAQPIAAAPVIVPVKTVEEVIDQSFATQNVIATPAVVVATPDVLVTPAAVTAPLAVTEDVFETATQSSVVTPTATIVETVVPTATVVSPSEIDF